jgi:hypothetical protein
MTLNKTQAHESRDQWEIALGKNGFLTGFGIGIIVVLNFLNTTNVFGIAAIILGASSCNFKTKLSRFIFLAIAIFLSIIGYSYRRLVGS